MRQNVDVYKEMRVDDERRFYPSYYPVAKHEPLNSNFTILESPEDIGYGLISLVSFEPTDLIAQCMGVAIDFQTLHSLEHKENIFYHDPFFSGYLLHSCQPNAKLDMSNFTLHAVEHISAFSLITIDYNATEKKLYQGFDCLCGHDCCKGWIGGYSYKEESR